MRKSRRRRTVAVFAGLLAVTGLVAATLVQANAAAADTVVVLNNAHGEVLIAAPDLTDKSVLTSSPLSHPANTATAAGPVKATQNQWLYPTGTSSAGAADATKGTITAAGASYVVEPYLDYYATFNTTTSRVAWTGNAPFNADSVKQIDDWHVDYFGDPFTVTGAPTGATTTIGATSADVQWTTTEQNTWFSQHSWDSVSFQPSGFGQIFRVRYDVTGVFQFGSAFYTVTGDDRFFGVFT